MLLLWVVMGQLVFIIICIVLFWLVVVSFGSRCSLVGCSWLIILGVLFSRWCIVVWLVWVQVVSRVLDGFGVFGVVFVWSSCLVMVLSFREWVNCSVLMLCVLCIEGLVLVLSSSLIILGECWCWIVCSSGQLFGLGLFGLLLWVSIRCIVLGCLLLSVWNSVLLLVMCVLVFSSRFIRLGLVSLVVWYSDLLLLGLVFVCNRCWVIVMLWLCFVVLYSVLSGLLGNCGLCQCMFGLVLVVSRQLMQVWMLVVKVGSEINVENVVQISGVMLLLVCVVFVQVGLVVIVVCIVMMLLIVQVSIGLCFSNGGCLCSRCLVRCGFVGWQLCLKVQCCYCC